MCGPEWVSLAVESLDGTGIPVAGVADFPDGAYDVERAVRDSLQITEAGGREVDVVIPWQLLAAGERGPGQEIVAAVRACLDDEIVLKAILETGELDDPELIAVAAQEAIAGGADFLKDVDRQDRPIRPRCPQYVSCWRLQRAHNETAGAQGWGEGLGRCPRPRSGHSVCRGR